MKMFIAVMLTAIVLLGSACAECSMIREMNGFIYSTPEDWTEQVGPDSTVYISEHGSGSRMFVATTFEDDNVSYSEHEPMFKALLLGTFEDEGVVTDFSPISINNWLGLSCCGYLDSRLNAVAFLTNETDTILFFLGDDKETAEPVELQKMLFDFLHVKVGENPQLDTSNFAEMTLAELIELRSQIQLAMWKSEEWQEVEVPQGVYRIGVDIPAGKWTITAACEQDPNVYYGDVLDGAGMKVVWSPNIYYGELLAGASGWREQNMPGMYRNSVTIELKNDTYLVIESGCVVFTPFIGVPALGFK